MKRYRLIRKFPQQINLQKIYISINSLPKKMSLSSMTVGGKIKYKIVLLGDQYVGKTSIIDRFINDRFEDSYNATIGIDFLVRNIVHTNKTYRLQLWDTAGQERFKSLIPSYLKDSNCAVIAFDLTSQKSLENVEQWLQLYNLHKEPLSFAILIGNKKDIKPSSCTTEMIEKMRKKLKLQTFIISAKTGQGVSDLFLNVIDLITQKIANYKIIDLIQERPALEEEETAKCAFSTSNQLRPPRISTIKLEEKKDSKILVHQKPCC